MEDLFYDLVVIGGGPGGYTAAAQGARMGMSVALVEMDALGGTCLNRGCIPTAAMLYAGEMFRRTREAERFGVLAGNVRLDYDKLLAYRSETIGAMVRGVDQMLEMEGIARFFGRGVLLPDKRVRVLLAEGQAQLSASNVLLATGSAARALDIPGAGLASVADSDGALAWRTLPESLTVIGGGVIGVEYAQAFCDLGSRVTLLGTRERLLPAMDREISQNLKMILKKRGVDVRTGVTVRRIEQENGALRCFYEEKGRDMQTVSQRVLYAVGRTPNTDGLFDGAGVDTDNGRIVVDSRFQTNLDGVYAVGDAIGGTMAHQAAAQATAAVEYMAGRTASVDVDTVPVCVYTDPEIACVGLTERQARQAGHPVKTGKGITGRNGRSAVANGEHGFVKIVASAADETLLGAQLMCARAGDMAGELVSAISNRLTAGQLLRAIRPHPTYNEMLTDALTDVLDARNRAL